MSIPMRPATPQPLLHHTPAHPTPHQAPQKYIILLLAPTNTAGKVQIAKSVSSTLSCPLFQGDSLHDVCARAALVGISKSVVERDEIEEEHEAVGKGAEKGKENRDNINKERYERMWLSKMTRTGLLFPDNSRAAGADFEGFAKRPSSAISSRRGSASSVEISMSSSFASASASASASDSDSKDSVAENSQSSSIVPNFAGGKPKVGFMNKSVQIPFFQLGKGKEDKRDKKALMVITHPEIEKWCRECIRRIFGGYGIGVIFVPLYEEELPVLGPRSMMSFGSFGGGFGNMDKKEEEEEQEEEEIVLSVDVDGNVEEIIEEIVEGVRDIMTS